MDNDFGLNLKLGFDGCLQKVLRRTMVDQEDIFKNQMCSSESVRNHCLIHHRDTPRHQQLSLDLELGSSRYSNGTEDFLSYCITPKVSASTKHNIYGDNYSYDKMLKPSLGADAETHQSSGGKICKDEIICSSQQATHLERSTYVEDLFPIPACATATFATLIGDKNEFDNSCIIKCRKNDGFNWISESRSLRIGMENVLKSEHMSQGVEQFHGDLSCKQMSSRRKPFACNELDLNKALPDDTLLTPIDPKTFNSSRNAFSSFSHNEIVDHGQASSVTFLNFTNTSALAQQEISASTVTMLPSKDSSQHYCRRKLFSIDLGSVSRCVAGTISAVNGSRSFTPENEECELSLQGKTSQRISVSRVDVEKKENNLLSYNSSQEILEEGADSNRSPLSCKSECNTDDASSKTNRRGSAIDIPDSNVSPSALKNSEFSLAAKDQVKQNMACPSDSKSQSSGAEVDKTVRKGAVSLIYFSCSSRNQECSPESKKRKKSCSAEREMPQSSYESIVLKQGNCSVEDYCVTSKPLEALGLDIKDNGVKLKRGRRMKDFRKEILPALASLSRQEICEDIKIMELALRSREYKKYSSNTVSRSDCIPSVRRRRPRRHRGGWRDCS